jgi:hypothetical protein
MALAMEKFILMVIQLIKIINKYIKDIIDNIFLLEPQKLEIINDSTYLID